MPYHIVAINGSTRTEAYNARLLQAIAHRYDTYSVELHLDLSAIPLYLADQESTLIQDEIVEMRSSINSADAVIISTPEYIHNIPAVLKNALEWLTESGEMNNKKTLPIVYSPNEPRGTHAMKSLLQSLTALNATIISSMQLYQNELIINEELEMSGSFSIELLDEAVASLFT